MIIIGLTGYKQAGKTTVARLISDELPNQCRHVNFADAVKREVAKACDTEVDFIEKNKSDFRVMLQWWGTDFRRKFKGDDYWLEQWLRTIHALPYKPQILLCSDVRFLNEARLIRELGGTIIRVNRDTVSSDGHLSEMEHLQIHADFTISNNDNIEQLTKQTHEKLTLCLARYHR
jgi:hypothetical protein